MKKVLWIVAIALILCITAAAPAEDSGVYSFQEDFEGLQRAAGSLFRVEAYNHLDVCTGSANGFVAFREHLFVTNLGVTDGASYLLVRDSSGNTYRLNLLLAVDREHDIAVFTFPEGNRYTPLEPETGKELTQGQPVVLIGNTGESGMVTDIGKITGFPVRDEYAGSACIEYSVISFREISGACLFDNAGKIIGITTSRSGEAKNTAIAVPVSYLTELVTALYPDRETPAEESAEPAEEPTEEPAEEWAAEPAEETEESEEDALIAAEIEGEWEITDISISGSEEDLAADLAFIRQAGATVTISIHAGKIAFNIEFLGERQSEETGFVIRDGRMLTDDGSAVDLIRMGDMMILLDSENSITLTRIGAESLTGDGKEDLPEEEPEPEPEEEPAPQYAYVSANSVNVREEPSDTSAKVINLSKYAYITVLDTVENGGSSWVYISYGEKEGYLKSVVVRLMSPEENEAFLQSAEYEQGVRNNSGN